MSFSFLDKNKSKNKDEKHSPEKDLEEKKALLKKCYDLLQKIKETNIDVFKRLNRVYRDGHAGLEVPRKKLQGFYGQLVDELRRISSHNVGPTPLVTSSNLNASGTQKNSSSSKKSTAKISLKKEKNSATMAGTKEHTESIVAKTNTAKETQSKKASSTKNTPAKKSSSKTLNKTKNSSKTKSKKTK